MKCIHRRSIEDTLLNLAKTEIALRKADRESDDERQDCQRYNYTDDDANHFLQQIKKHSISSKVSQFSVQTGARVGARVTARTGL